MGLALRTLPGHFEEKYGYRPLLAESFSCPQLHEGTIYKASNWTPLGFTKGYRHHKSEFYTDEKKPKRYWIHPLHKKARTLLSSPSPLPEIFQKATSGGVAERAARWPASTCAASRTPSTSCPTTAPPPHGATRRSRCSASSPTACCVARPTCGLSGNAPRR
jgi:hypothetical protein